MELPRAEAQFLQQQSKDALYLRLSEIAYEAKNGRANSEHTVERRNIQAILEAQP